MAVIAIIILISFSDYGVAEDKLTPSKPDSSKKYFKVFRLVNTSKWYNFNCLIFQNLNSYLQIPEQ